ncbi:MAG TPA: hypothetical protein VNJ08_10505 [Bacteriovoracaceae bacterium]|nr:hypothetical protein [Bacteriovoracaceae bacterium]
MRKFLQVLIVLITMSAVAQTIAVAKENSGASSSADGGGKGDTMGGNPGV